MAAPTGLTATLGRRKTPHSTLMRFLLFVFFALQFSLAACDRKEAPRAQAAPSGSTVSIVDIQPSTGIPLSKGQTFELKVKVSYTLTSESGTLGLVVQDASNTPLAQEINVVLRGSGTESFSLKFTVPETKAIQVFTALSSQGQSSTSTVSSRTFKVSAP